MMLFMKSEFIVQEISDQSERDQNFGNTITTVG